MSELKDMSKAVCRCKKVFFEDIEQVIKGGATTFEEVQAITKVGTGCKRCAAHAKEVTDCILSKM